MKNLIVCSALFAFLFSSCFVNRTTVGYGPVGESLHTRTFSKVKQKYVLFGLIRLNHVSPQTPPPGVGYEVKSDFGFVDGVLTLITAGIYGQRTVKILVDKNVEKEIQMEHKSQPVKH